MPGGLPEGGECSLCRAFRDDAFPDGPSKEGKWKKKQKFLLKAASIIVFLAAAFYLGAKNGAFVSAERFLKSIIFIKQTEDAKSEIETEVYSDEDKHIRMEIKRLADKM